MAVQSVQIKKVKAWVATLPASYLDCRARGNHVGVQFWVETGERDGVTVWLQHERCTCGTVRTRAVHRSTGRLIGAFAYDYPDDYVAPEGLGWSSVSAEAGGLYRLERINRWVRENGVQR